MKAIVVPTFGGPEVLRLVEIAEPEPRFGEIRVRVAATAINRADLLQCAGFYPAPAGVPADILGLEFAGIVDKLGDGVVGLALGDRVFGLVGGGAYAEALCIAADCVAKVPENLSLEQAAAVPEAFLTAFDAQVTQSGLQTGETILIHAVGSGVGTAAVQLARATGARTIGTARSPEKLARATALGLDVGIVPDGGFAKAVLAATAGAGVDVVLDLVGGDYIAEDLNAVAVGGRISVVGLVAGRTTEIDLGLLLRKRIRVQGTAMRSRALAERIAVAQVLARNIVPLLARGTVKPVIAEILPLADACAGHRLVASNDTFGKVVLRMT
jgi:NADPH:quinone reductase